MLTVSRELYAYWRKLKGERNAPERNDVEPGAIRAILADTFILDFDSARGFPLRISGSRGNALFLRELRGASFLQLWRESDRETVRAALHRAADHAQPYLLEAEARPPGLTALTIEVSLLPLRHQGSPHSRVLGAIAVESAPHWLGLVGAGEIALASQTLLDKTLPEPAADSAPSGVGFARPFSSRPRLVVCSSDRGQS